MRTALALLLFLAFLAALIYALWRGIWALLRRPVGQQHPSWRALGIAIVALFIGFVIVAPGEDDGASKSPAEESAARQEAEETLTPTATATATTTPTPAERRAARRARRQAAARERAEARARAAARARRRAQARAEARAKAAAKARREEQARARAEAREQARAEALQRERERNTASLEAGVTCDELGETNIPVIPGAEIDADNDGVGCED